MANTVAQYAVATFTSPVNGSSPIDANTVRGNDNTTRISFNSHDADPGIHLQSSTLASRPVAGTAGRKWITADTGSYRVWYDDGTNWQEVTYLSGAGGTITGNLLITGTLGVTGVITATAGVTGNLTGNATTATTLQTARTINGVSFNGSADITVTAAAGTLTGATLASNVLASSLTSVGTLANLTVTNTITGAVSGNAGTATTLATARNINGVSFNGSADITVTAAAGTLSGATLASGVTASSLTSVGTLTALAVSGVTTLSAGTAALPALTTTGDTNTGLWFPAADTIALSTNGTERIRLDNIGNIGLRTTPKGWNSTFPVIQLGDAGALWARSGGNDQDYVSLGANTYYDSTDSRYEYIGTGLATWYLQDSGEHIWYNAISGTADTPITFTQRMRLNTSGGLIVATATLGASAAQMFLGTTSATYASVGGANTGELILSADVTRFFDKPGSAEVARVTSGGNFGLGTSSFGTSAAKVISIGNGTAPSTSPANVGQLYVEAGALKYRGSSGTVTTVAVA
jgi:hypothetical protein